MDTSRTLLCAVVHPRLFPGPFTDPGNPLKVEMLVEVGTEELLIRAPAASTNRKIMGTESLAEIDRVTVQHISGSAQRLEIMRRSLLRMSLVAGVVLLLSLFRGYPFGISVLIALAVAAFIGPLNFLLNGGLGNKQDIVRFRFLRSNQNETFYLEVPPSHTPSTPTTESLTSALQQMLQPDLAARARSVATSIRTDGTRIAAQRLMSVTT